MYRATSRQAAEVGGLVALTGRTSVQCVNGEFFRESRLADRKAIGDERFQILIIEHDILIPFSSVLRRRLVHSISNILLQFARISECDDIRVASWLQEMRAWRRQHFERRLGILRGIIALEQLHR
jgi:hypothetical protein